MSSPNGVMMQYFHWYLPPDGGLWNQLAEKVPDLATAGITAVWLPPAYKGASGGYDVGYSVYDLYDLGEFDQKGSVGTKYGTKDQYIEAVKVAKSAGVEVYADIVLNHMMGADATEEAKAIPHDPGNGTTPIGDLQPVKVWTHFTFPGRDRKYSDMEWHWWNFDAVDYNANDQDFKAIYIFEGKSFDGNTDSESGAYDYLMGCDLDLGAEEVRTALKEWGAWFVNTTGVDGFRFDAIRHVRADFLPPWFNYCRQQSDKDLFVVGEYWSENVENLHRFISAIGTDVHLFDAPLHYNFYRASKSGSGYDLRQIFD
ncbi:MAG: alpha-amylase, partial [Nodosilinea sp.]